MHPFTLPLLSVAGLAALLAVSTNAVPAQPAMPFVPERFSSVGFPVSNGVEMHLIETFSDNGQVMRKWLSEKELLTLRVAGKNFMDVTFHSSDNSRSTSFVNTHSSFPTEVTQKHIAEPIIKTVSKDLLISTLTKLTEFHTRYYQSTTGVQSTNYLFDTVKEIARRAKRGVKVTVKQFEHSWVQRSIIARIEGQRGQEETVILGAHLDSINAQDPEDGRAPGADDDGSGTVAHLEAFRALIDNGFKPIRPIEFQWYSGEEEGLLGSQDIAASYQKEGRKVAGMLQLDLAGKPAQDRPTDLGLITDYVNDGLTNLLEAIMKTYVPELPLFRYQCGYACSDHASWTKYGFPSSRANEAGKPRSNPDIHTTKDTIESVNFDHMLRFSKISIGFAVELGNTKA